MGLIRSCGEAGMTVVCVTPSITVMPIHKSKYVSEHITYENLTKNRIYEMVCSVVQNNQGKRIVVFPASDKASCLIDDMWKEYNGLAIVPHAQGNIRKIMDKAEMSTLAMKCGLSVPLFRKVNLRDEPEPLFDIPCIIKPLKSISGEKCDIAICRTIAEMRLTFQHYLIKGNNEILLQQFVESDKIEEVAITGIALPSGETETYGMIHKIRTRGNGSTVYADYVPECEPEIREKVISFIKATKYQGIFDIEFLHNENGYHFIECNFRNGAYGYAVTSAGFNMPSAFAYNSRLPKGATLKRKRFMEERSDILNVLDKTISLQKWLKDVIKTNTFLWWNWHDPMPTVYYYLKKFTRR